MGMGKSQSAGRLLLARSGASGLQSVEMHSCDLLCRAMYLKPCDFLRRVSNALAVGQGFSGALVWFPVGTIHFFSLTRWFVFVPIRSKIELEPNTGVTFDDVAGADGAKLELQEIVNFLKEPAKSRDSARAQPGRLHSSKELYYSGVKLCISAPSGCGLGRGPRLCAW